MAAITCPSCQHPLSIHPCRRSTLTEEQRMYVWLFDMVMDARTTDVERARAREVMVRLGIAPSVKRRLTPVGPSTTFGELIRLVIDERCGTC